MNIKEILKELEKLGNSKIKKQYINNGAKEELIFGVTIKDLKPIAKQIQGNNKLAMELFNTLNYDAMYLAGMIVDASMMTKESFNDWISKAYFYMISDYIIAVTLAESPLALKLADEWIDSLEEMKRSAGWNTYAWVIGVTKDELLNKEKILEKLNQADTEYNKASNILKNAIDTFISAVGVQYLPLHKEALYLSKKIKSNATKQIEMAAEKSRLGFKRKNVRC